jgi:D-beta-D-heptose 7-phosphate kinase/D-beta-D-heptose 1-phosphate adenosyltransferase
MAGSGIAGWSDAPFSYAPKSPIRDVASVIGAGDCFAAILAFGIGHGLKIDDACELAFEAGSQYVTARHNRPLTWYEIHRKIDPTGAKIVNINDFNYIRKHVLENQKLVFSNGCFDFGLTRGHIDCLNFAKNNGEKLIVGINDDDSVRRLKGESRPIMNIEDRMYVVAGLESVDFVVKFSEDTPEKLIENIKPDLIVKGGDYKPHEVVGHKVCKVLICPMTESVSTTDKIKLISKEM